MGSPLEDVGAQAERDDNPRLGGVRFWAVSLWTWLLLGVAALALTVRRISLPAHREAS